MDIDSLTFGELKQIAKIFNASQTQQTSTMVGRKCVVRTYSAGVHFGTVAAHNDKQVVLTNARRIYYWEKAFTLSAVATHGIGGNSKVSCVTDEILLTEAIELIPMTEKAIKNLEAKPVHLEDDND